MKRFSHFKMTILFLLALLIAGVFVYVVQQEVKDRSKKNDYKSTQIEKYYPREQKGVTGSRIMLDRENKQEKKVTSETISLSEGIWKVVTTENKSFEKLYELYYFENELDHQGEIVDLFTVGYCDSFDWSKNNNDEIYVVYTTSPCEGSQVKNKRVYAPEGNLLYETIYDSGSSSFEFAIGEQSPQQVELVFSQACESQPLEFQYPRLELLPTAIISGVVVKNGGQETEYKLNQEREVECAVFYGEQIVNPYIGEPMMFDDRIELLLPGGVLSTLELSNGEVEDVRFELMRNREDFSDRTLIKRPDVVLFVDQLPEPCEFGEIRALHFSDREVSETVEYTNEERGIKMQIPYNAIWGYPEYRLNPYDLVENKLMYGTINTQGEGCGSWVQGTESITFLPQESKEDVLARLQKESEALEFGYTIKEYTIYGKEVVDYTKDGMCGGGGTIVIGERANYELSTICSSNLDIELIESMEFIQ